MAKRPSAKKRETKLQPLRIYLIKKDVKTFEAALRADVPVTKFALKNELEFKGAFYLRKLAENPVDWAKFVQTGLAKKLPPIHSTPNAGVLFLKVKQRIVAFVFGTGRYLLKDTAYESDFGLRSTLNVVNPKNLDQIDVASIGDIAVMTRKQVSKKSSLAAFEIDANRERFRSVTGKAIDEAIGTRVSGNLGGFGVFARLNFSDLAKQCERCIVAYSGNTYKKAFPKYDDLNVVRDPATLKSLDKELVEQLRKRDGAGLHLSPPELIDFEDFAGFSYSPAGTLFAELSVPDYFATNRDFGAITLDTLKSHRIFLRTQTHTEPLDRWSTYKCLIYEVKKGNSLFVLWSGQWHRIAQRFVDKVKDAINSIPEANTSLPTTSNKRLETAFLKEALKCTSDLALMDQKEVYCDHAGSDIEVCDLFSTRRQFIHVKRRATGASGLSHLFNQGLNSADAFIRDEVFRKETKRLLKAQGEKFAAKIPDRQPEAQKYEVVYVIMGRKRGRFVKELPFFSQLTLQRAASALRVIGFKVAFQFVECPE